MPFPFSLWALAGDSLIASAALSAVLPARRHAAPLIMSFGICDAAASPLGPRLGLQMPASGLLAPLFLALWGGLIMLNLRSIVAWCRSPRWAYLLPPLLAFDNLVTPAGGGGAPIAAGLASGFMAALGFGLGFALFGRLGGTRRHEYRPGHRLRHRLVGAPLALAGILLAI